MPADSLNKCKTKQIPKNKFTTDSRRKIIFTSLFCNDTPSDDDFVVKSICNAYIKSLLLIFTRILSFEDVICFLICSVLYFYGTL